MCGLFEPGIYSCLCYETVLFDASEKFESHTGWPSFTQPIISGLISVSPPLVVQTELLCGPEWAARRHSLTRQASLNRFCIRIIVRCVGHVLVIVQMHAVNLHMIDIDFPKHWLDVL
jgi:peptide methionine sulfoxide reductase MsrB